MLREITSLRLRRIVAPGDTLELEVKADEPDGSLRFDVRRAGEVVANASLNLGVQPVVASPLAGIGEQRRVVGAPDLDRLLPHRPPMRFIDAVETEFDGGVVCRTQVSKRCALTEDGTAPSLVAVEMAAQSAAIFESLHRSRATEGASGPRIGYLVGARDVKLARARVNAGTFYRATIRQSGFAPPLSTYEFALTEGVETIASGTLSTWLTATDA